MTKSFKLVLVLAVMLGSLPAFADSLTVYGAYNGGTNDIKLANSSFQVSIGPGTCANSGCTTTTYQVDYKIDFGNAIGTNVAPSGEGTGGAALYSIGFHTFNFSRTQSFVAPTTFNSLTINGVDATPSWGTTTDYVNGTVNASGCSSNSNGGWLCSKDTQSNPYYELAPQNGVFDFKFTVTAPTGTYITNTVDWSIKAEFCVPNRVTGTCGNNYDILSMNGGAPGQPPPGVTPEPASMVLLGTGLLGFGGVLRRFSNK